MHIDRGHFLSAVVGGLMAVLVVTALPAVADNGDGLVMGQTNKAIDKTVQKTKNPFVFHTTKEGRPAAVFNVNSGAPIQVNSAVRVDNLNADLLDGMDAADFAGAVAVNEGLAKGSSVELAAVTGARLLFQCNDDGAGGSTGQILVQAPTGDVHTVYRDPVTLAAMEVRGWNAHNALSANAAASLFTWDPDKTKQEFLDGWTHMYRFPLTVSSPKGGLIDGMLIGLLSDVGTDDCNITGYLIATG